MTDNTLMEFPCNFPVKIIGPNTEAFFTAVKAAVCQLFPECSEEHLVSNHSGGNRFLAVTATVYVTNQKDLDALYQALTQIPDVKMVL